MKATGIVRRIDDLGRVVIPKEIRRTMRIREGRHAGLVQARRLDGSINHSSWAGKHGRITIPSLGGTYDGRKETK